jgi:ABC-2 type transport system ATP-binding protein
MEYYLQTNKLTKRYGTYDAVKELNVHLKKGAIYGLIGPNGAGKTTLMKMIAGFATPTYGEINLLVDPEGQRRIGCLIENPGLYPGMSAYDNMKLKAIAMGLFDEKEIYNILDFVGLAKERKKKTKNYSLGMKQRLGIALALIGNPDFLILDEPINGLDPQGILEIRELILKLNRDRDMTIMISSHILEELSKVATDFGIIKSGQLIMEVTAEELKGMCQERVEIHTVETGRCTTVLESLNITEYSVERSDTIFAYNCTGLITVITKALVEQGVPVSQISINSLSLEEFYFETINK